MRDVQDRQNRQAEQPLRVLLLDDDQSELVTIGDILVEAGITVDLAATLDEALPYFAGNMDRFLLLLAVHAEPDAGAQVLAELDAQAEIRARCTVVDVARALGHQAARAARKADRVIEAPLSPKQLLNVIHEYARRSGSDFDAEL